MKTTITEADESDTKNMLGTKQEVLNEEQKILGVHWKFMEDCLIFDNHHIADLATELEPTKRNVVGMSTSFCDPLGVISPCMVQFKILFQQLCESRIGWNDPISGELLRRWDKLIAGLTGIQPFSIPKCYFNGVDSSMISFSLQGFGDASTGAYAAVIYLKLETRNGITLHFLALKDTTSSCSWSDNSKIGTLTALLLAKLLLTISYALELELSLERPSCYINSKVVFYWIISTNKEWKQFVQKP